ncbi:YbaB/EbfC family nucleoid-associated protein [Amycolatopsis sp. NPDC057786]|uniref:YbaB/EbfC family nucleoid-associated protein n=1 Tax=Amycolatopsis sp. NPDC057786 TaxID=3346250 RepID=UPI00366D6888
MAELGNPQLIEEMRWQLREIEARKAENAKALAVLAASGGVTEVTSPDGAVTVTVGPGGVIGEVRLTDKAMASSASALGDVITATIRRALTGEPAPRPKQPEPAEDDEPIDTVFDL